jgi:hypothetical protein
MDWMVQGSNPGRDKNFSILQIDQTASGTNPAFYFMGPVVLSWDLRCQDIKLTTDIYLVLRLVEVCLYSPYTPS